MSTQEIPIAFDCEGEQLIGVLHIPEQPLSAGVITVAAGPMQYRAGCGRQLITLARNLCAEGTPVMRFDHRGKGDSGGDLLGFEHIEEDLRRAIEVFTEHVPNLKHLILYGGCEAAAGIMISAWNLPKVNSLILANPWVDSESMQDLAAQNHYKSRIRDPQVWKKLFTGQYNVLEYAGGFFTWIKNKLQRTVTKAESDNAADASDSPFQERMLSGFQRFDGDVLFLKSGLSLLSEEFDQLVESSQDWQVACDRDNVNRKVMPNADQTFSTAAARQEITEATQEWLARVN